MAERGRTWLDAEIALLLQVWSKGTIKVQLLGAVRNEVPLQKDCRGATQGWVRSYVQVV